MSVWLIVGSDWVLDNHGVSIFDPGPHYLPFDALLFVELDSFQICVWRVSKNAWYVIFDAEIFKKSFDVFHDENELLVTIDDFIFSSEVFIFVVTYLIEVDESICITVETHALLIPPLIVETLWRRSLFLVDNFSSASFVQEFVVLTPKIEHERID